MGASRRHDTALSRAAAACSAFPRRGPDTVPRTSSAHASDRRDSSGRSGRTRRDRARRARTWRKFALPLETAACRLESGRRRSPTDPETGAERILGLQHRHQRERKLAEEALRALAGRCCARARSASPFRARGPPTTASGTRDFPRATDGSAIAGPVDAAAIARTEIARTSPAGSADPFPTNRDAVRCGARPHFDGPHPHLRVPSTGCATRTVLALDPGQGARYVARDPRPARCARLGNPHRHHGAQGAERRAERWPATTR